MCRALPHPLQMLDSQELGDGKVCWKKAYVKGGDLGTQDKMEKRGLNAVMWCKQGKPGCKAVAT